MLDGRFHLNSSSLETILNLLSTISFSDSVRPGWWTGYKRWGLGRRTFHFFSCFHLDFFLLFLLKRFAISRLDEGEFLFLFLDLCCLSCLLVEEVSAFSNTLLAGSSYELSPSFPLFCPTSSLEVTAGEVTFTSFWSLCRDSAYSKLCDSVSNIYS